MDDFKRISVYPGIQYSGIHYQVAFNNPTSYPFVGAGAQGAVFLLTSEQCVKIYALHDEALRETNALASVQGSAFFPKLYESGPNYNVMEFIKGPSLDQFLHDANRLDFHLTCQLVDLFEEMNNLNLSRIDAALRHLFLTESQTLKVIDHVNSFQTVSSYPKLLLTELNSLGLLSAFLEQVKSYKPYLLREWSIL